MNQPIILILILLVFIALPLLQFRKQNQRIKAVKEFQATLQPGMVVKTTSGLHGRITHVGEHTVDLEVSPGVVSTWDRVAILEPVSQVESGSQQEKQLAGEDGSEA